MSTKKTLLIKARRPLSPHLSIYRPQISSMTSIFHRLTGVALHFGLLALIWFFVYLIYSPSEEIIIIENKFIVYLAKFILLGWVFSTFYHLLCGIRHLFWDIGYGFDLETVDKTGLTVVIGSVVLTAIAVYLLI